MDINAEAVINGLLDEIKRLTLDNVALKAMIIDQNHSQTADSDDQD
jgi:hypothetical protein